MIKPTKKNKKKWVDEHLNGGNFPPSEVDYRNEIFEKYDLNSWDHACYGAMCWLDNNNIKSLEEAWDKCPNWEWLDWMLKYMDMTYEETNQYDSFFYNRMSKDFNADSMRSKMRNPWVLKNYGKVFEKENK